MAEVAYQGLLCIGDPHLASRVPGYRKDDYPRVALGKLKWAMDHAREHRLLPVILGDLFHVPRDNANWLVVELLETLGDGVLAVAGNHDCSVDQLTDDDTLAVLSAAGRIHLLDRRGPWSGMMNGTRVTVGGTAYGQRLPERHDRAAGQCVFWVAHHDVKFPGYEEAGRLGCREIPGVDAVINGHIHRPLEDVVCGATTWINPGNITRVSRGDASRGRRPMVLRIDVDAGGGWTRRLVEVPHRPFEEVFHELVQTPEQTEADSLFIRGLAQLESLRTAGGAGIGAFVKQNLEAIEREFGGPVAREIDRLAQEVMQDGDEPEEHGAA